MRPVGFGEALAAGTRLTLFSNDKADPFFTVIKFWMDETSGVALELKTGVPSYQVEDEEGRNHLLIHLPIEEDGDRWCLWRPDHAGFDSRLPLERLRLENFDAYLHAAMKLERIPAQDTEVVAALVR